MRAFDRLRAMFRPAAKDAPRAAVQEAGGGVTITNAQELEHFLRLGGVAVGGMTVTPESAMRVGAVFACVRIIAGAVATMPLALKRRMDSRTREDASDHPLWTVLRRPNSWMTRSAFRRMLTAHVLLRGNAYAMIVRGVGGKVIALWPMHPDRVRCEQLDDMSVVYIYRRKDGREITLPKSEVFHLVGLTLDGVTGVSVIRYAASMIGLSLATDAHGQAMFANGTNVGSVLKAKGQLGLEAQAVLRASLEAYRGAENAHKTLILEEDMDFEKLGMTAADAQLVENRKLTRGDIAMFFGVPPHMIGDTEKATSWGSGIEQQSQGFVAYTLQDWLTTWEETIERDLIDPIQDPGLFARFNTGGLIRGDMATRFAAYAVARQWGWYSANDVLELEDRNPIPGGDVYLTPMNMAEIGKPGSNMPPDALKALRAFIRETLPGDQ
jgi:HK97 family phage portal protein